MMSSLHQDLVKIAEKASETSLRTPAGENHFNLGIIAVQEALLRQERDHGIDIAWFYDTCTTLLEEHRRCCAETRDR